MGGSPPVADSNANRGEQRGESIREGYEVSTFENSMFAKLALCKEITFMKNTTAQSALETA